jgi:predicted ArsR family transcriptional regulator
MLARSAVPVGAVLGLLLLALAPSAGAVAVAPGLAFPLAGDALPTSPLPGGPPTDLGLAPGARNDDPGPSAPDLVAPAQARDDGAWTLAGAVGAAGLLGLAVWGGTRFRGEEVLEHALRARIYRHIQEHVGVSLKELTEALGLSTTNAVWHLRKLEDSGLVRGRKSNGAKVYYATSGGVQARDLSLASAALISANARDIVALVQRHPGVHQREVARLLGVNHGTVRWHLKKLRESGLLEERRSGAATTYHCTTLGADALRAQEARAFSAPAPAVAQDASMASPPTQA